MLEEEVVIFVSSKAGGLMTGVHFISVTSKLTSDPKASYAD